MSFSELVFIMVLGLILFGPDELPKIARGVGKAIYEIKKASTDVTGEVRKAVVDEPKQVIMQAVSPEENNAKQEIPQPEQKKD